MCDTYDTCVTANHTQNSDTNFSAFIYRSICKDFSPLIKIKYNYFVASYFIRRTSNCSLFWQVGRNLYKTDLKINAENSSLSTLPRVNSKNILVMTANSIYFPSNFMHEWTHTEMMNIYHFRANPSISQPISLNKIMLLPHPISFSSTQALFFQTLLTFENKAVCSVFRNANTDQNIEDDCWLQLQSSSLRLDNIYCPPSCLLWSKLYIWS